MNDSLNKSFWILGRHKDIVLEILLVTEGVMAIVVVLVEDWFLIEVEVLAHGIGETGKLTEVGRGMVLVEGDVLTEVGWLVERVAGEEWADISTLKI